MWQAIRKRTREFLHEEQGPTATEYAVMFSIILLGMIVAVKAIGTKVNDKFVQAAQGW